MASALSASLYWEFEGGPLSVGPGAKALVRGSGGRSLPEAENILIFAHTFYTFSTHILCIFIPLPSFLCNFDIPWYYRHEIVEYVEYLCSLSK